MSEKPEQPWFISTPEGIIKAVHCTCMAGLGETCTHSAAIMWYVQHMMLNKEETSVTSVAPYWGVPKKDALFCEVRNLEFAKNKENISPVVPPAVPRMDQSSFRMFCEKLKLNNQDSAICNVVRGLNEPDSNKLYLSNLFQEDSLKKSLEDLQTAALNVNLDFDALEAAEVNKQTISQYKSRKWFLYRAGLITASNLKAVCTTDINKPAISTVKKICYPTKMIFHSKMTAWGCEQEKNAKERYIRLQRRNHPTLQVSTCGLLLNPKYPFLGASPDGLLMCQCCGLGCLEIKCPYCLRGKDDSLKDHMCLENVNSKTMLSKKHSYYYQA